MLDEVHANQEEVRGRIAHLAQTVSFDREHSSQKNFLAGEEGELDGLKQDEQVLLAREVQILRALGVEPMIDSALTATSLEAELPQEYFDESAVLAHEDHPSAEAEAAQEDVPPEGYIEALPMKHEEVRATETLETQEFPATTSFAPERQDARAVDQQSVETPHFTPQVQQSLERGERAIRFLLKGSERLPGQIEKGDRIELDFNNPEAIDTIEQMVNEKIFRDRIIIKNFLPNPEKILNNEYFVATAMLTPVALGGAAVLLSQSLLIGALAFALVACSEVVLTGAALMGGAAVEMAKSAHVAIGNFRAQRALQKLVRMATAQPNLVLSMDKQEIDELVSKELHAIDPNVAAAARQIYGVKQDNVTPAAKKILEGRRGQHAL
jgi:hypothetical protein